MQLKIRVLVDQSESVVRRDFSGAVYELSLNVITN